MRLWGKVVSGFMLVMAAVFAVVAMLMPEERWKFAAAAAGLTIAALYGVPALVKVFSSFTGDEEILANGVAGSATITSLKPTGWRYNRYYPIVKFGLSVEAGGAAYPVEIKQAVDPELLQRLSPGALSRCVSIGRTTRRSSSTGASRFVRPLTWQRTHRRRRTPQKLRPRLISPPKAHYGLFSVGAFSSSV